MIYYNRRNQQNERVIEIYERKFGKCSFEEKEFVLISHPQIQWDGTTYVGHAISPEDIETPNEGELPIYELIWESFEELEEQKSYLYDELSRGSLFPGEFEYGMTKFCQDAFDVAFPIEAELTGDSIDLKTGRW